MLGGGDGDGNRSNYQRVIKALPRESLRKAYQEIESRLAEVWESRSTMYSYLLSKETFEWTKHIMCIFGRCPSSVTLTSDGEWQIIPFPAPVRPPLPVHFVALSRKS